MANQIIKGDDLMLFDKDGKSIAFAKNHTLSISADAADISSKDHGIWGGKEVNKISWEIQSENLYTASEYDKLFTSMMERKAVKVYFGLKNENDVNKTVANGDYTEWSAKAGNAYIGDAFITSLTANAQSGDNATFSVTLSGNGKLSKAAQVTRMA